MCSTNTTPEGVDFTSKMDAVAIAEAFGVRGVRITHSDQLDAAVIAAMQTREPTFIDVPAKTDLEEVPPVHAWQAAFRVGNGTNESKGKRMQLVGNSWGSSTWLGLWLEQAGFTATRSLLLLQRSLLIASFVFVGICTGASFAQYIRLYQKK
jgi:hypothetical protein